MSRRISICAVMFAGAVLLSVTTQGSAQQQDPTKRPAEVIKEDADNTKVNRRESSRGEATADRQREKPADRMVSQRIRRAVTRNPELSSYARNVKIITQDGTVTLKGPVRSEKERNAIEAIAVQMAGKDRVTNEIQIAPEKN